MSDGASDGRPRDVRLSELTNPAALSSVISSFTVSQDAAISDDADANADGIGSKQLLVNGADGKYFGYTY